MTQLRVNVDGLERAETGLRRWAAQVGDLRPFWRELGRGLAETIDASWPLRRRTGRLRESLTWAGNRLGRGGVFESSPDKLTFGTALFYGRFAQFWTRKQRATPLIHVNPDQHADQLSSWLQARAGLEVT